MVFGAEDGVGQVEAELLKTLKDGGLDPQVSGREKTPYSIWRKMQQKNVSFEQLADIIRAVVVTLPDEALARIDAALDPVVVRS